MMLTLEELRQVLKKSDLKPAELRGLCFDLGLVVRKAASSREIRAELEGAVRFADSWKKIAGGA